MIRSAFLSLVVGSLLATSIEAADYFPGGTIEPRQRIKISGRAAVFDGRSLWFGDRGMLVRLAGIDSCELPQWAFAPNPRSAKDRPIAPIACGGLAKAWLKRLVGRDVVRCDLAIADGSTQGEGVCRVQGRDLALDMLHVGWAKSLNVALIGPEYDQAQRYAMAARYGVWATYLLDMDEWRRKAIDKTLDRTPQADLNLLTTRESEISPPFADLRQRPVRRDR